MSTQSLQSYFNPRHHFHHACRKFANLNWWQKSVVGSVAAVVSIVALPIFALGFLVGTGVLLGIATFRKLSEVFSSKRVQIVNNGPRDLIGAKEELNANSRSSSPQVTRVLSQKETQKMKCDAQKHNAQNQYLRLPMDMHREILSYITDAEDLKNVALASESLKLKVWDSVKTKAKFATNTIQQLIDFAIRLDEKINIITDGEKHLIEVSKNGITDYHRFQFDRDKWQLIANNIEKNLDLAANADKMQAACRLDLVEALAEYNCIESYEVNNEVLADRRQNTSPQDERPISQIDIDWESIDLKVSEKETLKQIIEDAKATVKGDAFIIPGCCWPNIKNFFGGPMLPSHSQDKEKARLERHWEGPFLGFWMANLESENWHSHYYSRHIRGEAIHIDWLLGKREGDRIVIPLDEKEETADKQMILRLRQKSSRYNRYTFENLMILSLLRMLEPEDDRLEPEKSKKLLENLETAYGKELIEKHTSRLINEKERARLTMEKINKLKKPRIASKFEPTSLFFDFVSIFKSRQ